MKTTILITLIIANIFSAHADEMKSPLDTSVLIGTWKLDLSPHDSSDANFAIMKVHRIDENGFYGEFYRDGVTIQKGQINTQTHKIHAALISQDNSGSYNSSFYFHDGMLYGSTHAVDRDFLAVWSATKE
ncbi:hypothetical protein [Marinicella sp. W31]|uniref:hypothetical protein n=1 Tax=Marinicella sp. W31 TaxID=3023713 RepID=UPI003757F6F1